MRGCTWKELSRWGLGGGLPDDRIRSYLWPSMGLGRGLEIKTNGVKEVCSVRSRAGEDDGGRAPGRGHLSGGMQAVH